MRVFNFAKLAKIRKNSQKYVHAKISTLKVVEMVLCFSNSSSSFIQKDINLLYFFHI